MEQKVKNATEADTQGDIETDTKGDIEVRCGYGSCHPGFLQRFNNSKFMLAVMCFYVFSQGFVVNGVFNVIVSTLERRFQLRSTQMGLVSSAYDFSAAFFGILISYLGSGRHKSRWLAVSGLFMIIGSVTMAIPHFTTDPYKWGEGERSTCDKSSSNTTSVEVCIGSGLQNYVGVFALSNVLFGIGGATLYTVGTAYIDDSVPALMSPMYLGIYFGFAALGPGVGFLVGGAFLDIYVDVDRVNTESLLLRPSDTRWVGAWWIAPILSAILFVIAALIMACFGAELPTSNTVRETRESQMHKGSSTKMAVTEPTRPPLKTVHRVFWALLHNPPFLFTTLAGITESMFISGLSVFGAKYLQNGFRISTARSGIFTGAAVVLGLAGGIMFGGVVCRCFKLKVTGMLKFAFGACVISTFCIGMMLMSCGQTTLAGIHAPYSGSTEASLYDECNAGCQCTTQRFELSCDASGVQYFSPCFAGCGYASNETSGEYSDCTCISLHKNASLPELTEGSCESGCSLLYPFVFMLFLYAFTTIAADVPAEQAVLRSIDENHRTLMCGSNRFFVRLLGTVPGAVIMGVATDAGCLIWQTECGENTSCWLYDISIVSRNYFIFGLVSKVFSMTFFFCALWFYKPPRDIEVDIDVKRETVSSNNLSKSGKETDSVEGNDTFENDKNWDTVHSNNALENDTKSNQDEKNISVKNENTQDTIHQNNADSDIRYNKQDTQSKAPTDHVDSLESTNL